MVPNLIPGVAGDPDANHHGHHCHPNMRELSEDVHHGVEEEEQAPVLLPSPKSYLLLTAASHLRKALLVVGVGAH